MHLWKIGLIFARKLPAGRHLDEVDDGPGRGEDAVVRAVVHLEKGNFRLPSREAGPLKSSRR